MRKMTRETAPARNGARRAPAPPPVANPCPDCGGARGRNNRCYACRPWDVGGNHAKRARMGRPATPGTKNACPRCQSWKSRHHRWCLACERVAVAAVHGASSPPPVAAPAPSPRLADDLEMRALVTVVAALDPLDEAARRRVGAFVAARFGPASPAGEVMS